MGRLERLFAAVAVLASTLIGYPSHAKTDTLKLQPDSPWRIEYADDKCKLSRVFGTGDDRLKFQLEQHGPEPFFNLLLMGQPARSKRRRDMEIQFGPNESPMERSFLAGKLKESNDPFIVMYGVHLAAPAEDTKQGEFIVVDVGPTREEAITKVSFRKGLRNPLQLELGSMGEPLAAMRHCIVDLVEQIGLDKESQAQLSRQPWPTNEREVARFLLQRYPRKMVAEKTGGTVKVRVTVDSTGKAVGCQIAKSDRPAVFDDLVCFGVLRIAKFKPALGPDGKPQYGFWRTNVTYRPD